MYSFKATPEMPHKISKARLTCSVRPSGDKIWMLRGDCSTRLLKSSSLSRNAADAAPVGGVGLSFSILLFIMTGCRERPRTDPRPERVPGNHRTQGSCDSHPFRHRWVTIGRAGVVVQPWARPAAYSTNDLISSAVHLLWGSVSERRSPAQLIPYPGNILNPSGAPSPESEAGLFLGVHVGGQNSSQWRRPPRS